MMLFRFFGASLLTAVSTVVVIETSPAVNALKIVDNAGGHQETTLASSLAQDGLNEERFGDE